MVKYMRSLLFVPGNQPSMLQKALNLQPDAFIPDLEDSVPEGSKEEARRITSEIIPFLAKTGVKVIPRVNAIDTEFFEKDLWAVLSEHIFGIAVGKINRVDDVKQVASLMDDIERTGALKNRSVKLILWIETAMGLQNVYDILSCSERIYAAAFGAEDFTNDMGIQRYQHGREILFARNSVAIASKAAGVLALDTPFVSYQDQDGLRKDAAEAKLIGFKGKFAIHPSQIEPINACFSPSSEQIHHAKRVLEAFGESEKLGKGATSLDGLMIDIPIVKRAEGLLKDAHDMGII